MLEYFMLVLATFLCPTQADDVGFYISPNDSMQCASDLMKWCDEMKYPQEGAGMTMISVNIQDPEVYIRVLCMSDSEGTNCTKNGSPWFACTKDNKFYYKGNQLQEGSDEGTDEEICSTASRAFNDLMVQNMSYDNETMKQAMEQGMKSFFEEMAAMQEQIKLLNEKMMSMFGNSWNNYPFGNNWNPFGGEDSSSESSSEEELTTIQNQLEKE